MNVTEKEITYYECGNCNELHEDRFSAEICCFSECPNSQECTYYEGYINCVECEFHKTKLTEE